MIDALPAKRQIQTFSVISFILALLLCVESRQNHRHGPRHPCRWL